MKQDRVALNSSGNFPPGIGLIAEQAENVISKYETAALGTKKTAEQLKFPKMKLQKWGNSSTTSSKWWT